MKNVSTITKFTCQELRDELNAVLAKFGQDCNLEFDVGNMKFTAESVDMKLTAKVKGRQVSADLESYASIFDLTLDQTSGRQLIEYNSRQYKFPFIYLQDGKRYKCNKETAMRYFKKAA
jgi:hypothetical protein